MKIIARLLAIALVSLPTMAFAQTMLQQYQPGPRLIDGNQLNLMVNAVNGIQGNGGSVGKGYFSLNTGSATGPTPETGTVLQVVGANATTSRIENDSFGGVPIFTARRADGTKAAPTAILSADQLGSYNFGGAVSAAAYYVPAASLRSYATENWSGTAGGTKITFATTPNTTQTLTDAVTIGQDQSLTVVGAIIGPSVSVTAGLKSSGPTGAGIGYSTGAGGAITQITNRTTGVTLSKLSGTITTANNSLAAETAATFTVTNTTVAATDTVVVSISGGSNGGNTTVTVTTIAGGSFNITVANQNASGGAAETGAIVINYAVFKAVAS